MDTLSNPPGLAARPAPPLDNHPAVRAVVAVFAAGLFAISLYGLLRWLVGLAPPTPWVHSLALAVHIATVIPAIPLGAYVLFARKGGTRHKVLGYIWLSLMVVTAIATVFVREVNNGRFSWIHLFTLMTFASIPRAILSARRGDFCAHRSHLLGFYAGSLLVAGLFSFIPGRTMWQWIFVDRAPAAAPSHG